MAKHEKQTDKRFFFNKNDIAFLLGVTTVTVGNWVDRRGMPVHSVAGKEKIFYLPDVIAWIRKRNDEKEGALDLSAERAKLARAQTEKYERENRKKSAELLDVFSVAKWISDLVSNVKMKFLAIPSTIAPELQTAKTVEEKKRIVYFAINDTLNELSDDAAKHFSTGDSKGTKTGSDS